MMRNIFFALIVSCLGVLTIAYEELFATLGAAHCAEGLHYGPEMIHDWGTQDGNTFYLRTRGFLSNQPHRVWKQVVSDGATELFTITWTFATPRSLPDRMDYVVANNNDAVSWVVVDTAGLNGVAGTSYSSSGFWQFSSVSGVTAALFAGRGNGFSGDDGVWGGANNGLVVNGALSTPTAGFWGIGSFNQGDAAACTNVYYNGNVASYPNVKTNIYAVSADDLFAIVGDGKCGEALPYGQQIMTTSGSFDGNNAYYLTVEPFIKWNYHTQWTQIVQDGATELFRIVWQFDHPKNYIDRFMGAVESGETVTWTITDTANAGAVHTKTGTWRLSSAAALTTAQFSSTGAAFSVDDAAWGAATGEVNGNSAMPADFWGIANFVSTDAAECNKVYTNGASTVVNGVKSLFYITEQYGAPTTQPTSQPSLRPTNQPTSSPTGQPNVMPTSRPSTQPTSLPTSQPSSEPTSQPSSQPSRQPTSRPTGQPSSQPSRQPSSQPSGQPTSAPSRLAKKRKYRLRWSSV